MPTDQVDQQVPEQRNEVESDTEPTDDVQSDTEPTDDVQSETEPTEADDQERRDRTEAFAAEHDPAEHDIAKGEEFRQRGDWTAEEAGGPQQWDFEGHLAQTGAAETTDDDGGSRGADGESGLRFSRLSDVRDGGYGIGSAAPLPDGVIPFGHQVKAWEDTKTFVSPGYPGFEDVPPHVWFADEAAAHRAGFRHVD